MAAIGSPLTVFHLVALMLVAGIGIDYALFIDAGIAIGEPQGSDLLVEWVNGKLLPVYPKNVALHAPLAPKPAWGT